MLARYVCFIIFLSGLLISFKSKGQILFDLKEYRNLTYASSGYNGAFENFTLGVARRDYFKLIKREIVGVLDISLPLNNQFFTRRGIRKGFQVEVWKNNSIKVPFMFASSSIVRENRYFKFHDITAEFSLVPGMFKEKYSLAIDLRYELIVFRYEKFKNDYYHEIDPSAKSHWEKPYYSIAKIGIMGGLNFNRFVVYVKTGYERNPTPKRNYLPGYALIGMGYKFGKKPIK